MAATPPPLLTDLLSQVSRSFYLTLRVLPRAVRPQIGLAYLLARTTDTVADTNVLPAEQRLGALGALRERILGRTTARLRFNEFLQAQASPAERALLERVEESLSLLGTLETADASDLRHALDVIMTGQELDLLRFGAASRDQVAALPTRADLDDYTYRVAGCVGEFWTKLCCRHLFAPGTVDESQLLADGVRFGRGLQLVNILRDLASDLADGRCYLPAEELRRAGLTPGDLLLPMNEEKARPLYDELMQLAEEHLRAGWRYTNSLPTSAWRLRLACAWPVLLGMETLRRLRTARALDSEARVKVPRSEVRRVLWRSVVRVPFPAAFAKLWVAMPDGKAVASPTGLA